MTVDLSDQEWGQVMQVLATAPWNVANPLLMKIGEQLRKAAQLAAGSTLSGYPGSPAENLAQRSQRVTGNANDSRLSSTLSAD